MGIHACRKLIVTITLCVATLTSSSLPAHAAPCWVPPVRGDIIDPFRKPPCPYCAGNRGIEYRVSPGQPVRAVQAGEVTYAGSVAATSYVVITHANGWKITYGRLAAIEVTRGQRVARGTQLGVTGSTFYFGLRVDDDYTDPAPFLAQQRGRPRLVPIDGTPRRRPPEPRWSCTS